MKVSVISKDIYELHAQVCKVWSSPKRLLVIDPLRDGERTLGELVRHMGIGKANLSQQLAFMRSKGILEARRDGQRIYYRLAYPDMLKPYDLLRQVLFTQLEDRPSWISSPTPTEMRSALRNSHVGARAGQPRTRSVADPYCANAPGDKTTEAVRNLKDLEGAKCHRTQS